MRVQYSAPAKVIITGEHSVAHGKLALAAAINLKCNVTLNSVKNEDNLPSQTKFVLGFGSDEVIVFANEDIVSIGNQHYSKFYSEDLKPTEDQIEAIYELLKAKTCSKFVILAGQCFVHSLLATIFPEPTNIEHFRNFRFHIELQSEVPLGAGLGSSAAVNTVISACLLDYFKSIHGAGDEVKLDDKFMGSINRLAFAAEHIVHGKPSGVDTYASCYGKGIVFENFSFKSSMVIPDLHVLVVNTNQARNTKSLVDRVRSFKESDPDGFERVLNDMNSCSLSIQNTISSLVANKSVELFEQFSRLVLSNHTLLQSLGVSTDMLDAVVTKSTERGCPAKLTGAGGGGCAIVFLKLNWELEDPTLKTDLEETFTSMGCNVFLVHLGADGVQKIT